MLLSVTDCQDSRLLGISAIWFIGISVGGVWWTQGHASITQIRLLHYVIVLLRVTVCNGVTIYMLGERENISGMV